MAGPFGDAAPGEVIGGYRLERLIGSGSTSQVFLGVQVRVNRQAAIKVLSHALYDNKEVISRMLREARVVNDIRHPNIIDILDFVETESPPRVALVMEYIEGPSLKALRDKQLAFDQALAIAIQLVAAVEAAHKAGVIHRDIKPDNLLLTRDPLIDPRKIPNLKVVDFGIAKLAGSSGKTATGIMLGTPAYMAPEQVAGRPPASPATDVFAIGEVLYELLTGTRAYPSGAIHETVRAKLRGDMPKLELPPVPGDKKLLQIIIRCLALKQPDRPALDEVRDLLLELMPPLRESSAWSGGGARPGKEPATMPWLRPQVIQDVPIAQAAQSSSSGIRMDSKARPRPPDPADPMSQFAPAVLSHGSTDVASDLLGPGSIQTEMFERPELGLGPPGATSPPPAATEVMSRLPQADISQSIPLQDTSPTNKVLQAQTVAAPLPERNAAPPRAPSRRRSHADATPPHIETEETEEVDASNLRNDFVDSLPPLTGSFDGTPRPEAATRLSIDAQADSEPSLERDTHKIPGDALGIPTAPIDVSAARAAFPMSEVHSLSPNEAPLSLVRPVTPLPETSSHPMLTPTVPPAMAQAQPQGSVPARSASIDTRTANAEYTAFGRESVASSVAAERRKTKLLLVVMAGLLVIALGLLIPMLLPPPSSGGEARATIPGRVVVSSNPAGARVEDPETKQALGNTPVEVDVPKGSRAKRLRITSAGYRPMEIDLTDSHPRVWVELEKAP